MKLSFIPGIAFRGVAARSRRRSPLRFAGITNRATLYEALGWTRSHEGFKIKL